MVSRMKLIPLMLAPPFVPRYAAPPFYLFAHTHTHHLHYLAPPLFCPVYPRLRYTNSTLHRTKLAITQCVSRTIANALGAYDAWPLVSAIAA